MYNRTLFSFTVIILFAIVIYAWVFWADYLYLDDAFALWHRERKYIPFASQGRLLTGLLYEQLFTVIDTIAEMKYFRILSLISWTIASGTLCLLAKRWVKELGLSPYLPFLLAIFCICSPAVAVYIGWASCFQVSLAFLPALFSGHYLFLMLSKQKEQFNLSLFKLALVVGGGVVSLLIYQNAFGIFLLPFLLLWISSGASNKNRKLIIAIVIYLVTYLAYFLVFKYYLKQLNIQADIRTDLVFNPFKKAGFFFSTPFSQAWSLNFLHNLHSIVSQVFPLLVFVVWLFLFVRQSGQKKAGQIIISLVVIIFILALSYLPSIVAKENFSSYRTMIALNLFSTALLIQAVMVALKTDRNRMIAVPLLAILLFAVAYVNFNTRFIHPLRKEFNAFQSTPLWQQVKNQDTIVFIRAESRLFEKIYGIPSIKDEFGKPSTYRDWTLEGLTRKLVEERQSPALARSLTILQFENRLAYDTLAHKPAQPILADMNEIISNK